VRSAKKSPAVQRGFQGIIRLEETPSRLLKFGSTSRSECQHLSASAPGPALEGYCRRAWRASRCCRRRARFSEADRRAKRPALVPQGRLSLLSLLILSSLSLGSEPELPERPDLRAVRRVGGLPGANDSCPLGRGHRMPEAFASARAAVARNEPSACTERRRTFSRRLRGNQGHPPHDQTPQRFDHSPSIAPTRARRRTGLRLSGAVRPLCGKAGRESLLTEMNGIIAITRVAKSFPRVSAISAGEVALGRRNSFIQSDLIV
jgi:hypothetical protein